MEITSLSSLRKELATNKSLQDDFREDPVKAMQQIQSQVPNNLLYQLVVGALGVSIILVIIGIVVLSLSGPIEATVTTLFTAIASGAVGALAGLLAPSPAK